MQQLERHLSSFGSFSNLTTQATVVQYKSHSVILQKGSGNPIEIKTQNFGQRWIQTLQAGAMDKKQKLFVEIPGQKPGSSVYLRIKDLAAEKLSVKDLKTVESLKIERDLADPLFYVKFMQHLTGLLRAEIKAGRFQKEEGFFRTSVEQSIAKLLCDDYLRTGTLGRIRNPLDLANLATTFKKLMMKMPNALRKDLFQSLKDTLNGIDVDKMEEGLDADAMKQFQKNFPHLPLKTKKFFLSLTYLMNASYKYSWEHLNVGRSEREQISIMLTAVVPMPIPEFEDPYEEMSAHMEINKKLTLVVMALTKIFIPQSF